jgi:uncharacterized protein YwqG
MNKLKTGDVLYHPKANAFMLILSAMELHDGMIYLGDCGHGAFFIDPEDLGSFTTYLGEL